MKISIFGDSIIWGAFLPFRGAWSNLLRNYLEGIDDRFAVYDLGIDTNTTEDLLTRFKSEAGARKPDLLIFAIGTNDSAFREPRHKNLTPVDNFKKNIKRLIDESKQFTNKIIFVGLAKGDDSKTMPLPRSSSGKHYTKKDVSEYNEIIKDLCAKEGIDFVDIYNELKDEDFDDGVHPNLGGHQKIFEAVRRVLKSYLPA